MLGGRSMERVESGSSWIRKIVAASGGSPAGDRGLEQVADLARRIGARIVVVFVRHRPVTSLMAPGMTATPSAEALDDQEAEVRRDVTRILGGASAGWEFGVGPGPPGADIVQVAAETSACL